MALDALEQPLYARTGTARLVHHVIVVACYASVMRNERPIRFLASWAIFVQVSYLLSGCYGMEAFSGPIGESVAQYLSEYQSKQRSKKIKKGTIWYSEESKPRAYVLIAEEIDGTRLEEWTYHGFRDNERACHKDMKDKSRWNYDGSNPYLPIARSWEVKCEPVPYRDEIVRENVNQ